MCDKISKYLTSGLAAFILLSIISSCDDFLEVKGPSSKIEGKVMFSDDVTATSAITGIYQNMLDPSSFSSGTNNSITYLSSMSADELKDFYRTDPIILEIEQNDISIQNSYVSNLWSSLYKTIFATNSAIEGITLSTGMGVVAKNQLKGEALFIRGLCHFYLVNLFGDVPIVVTTSYTENSEIQRSPITDVYDQIIVDLIEARDLMAATYPTTGKVRPNKFVASALLARVYLFTKQWDLAMTEASSVIDQTALYNLTDLNSSFLANSKEAIWQLMPITPKFNTWEGYYFVISPLLGPTYVTLHEELLSSFEPDDNRLTSWVGSYDTGNGIIYYPNKYKADLFAETVTEYTNVLRLSEQYLIRSEANAMIGNINEAITDLDVVRKRAGLNKIIDTEPGISQTNLLEIIYHERRIELFTEWGHRWLDLKRLNRADELSAIKENWKSGDSLYPIPAIEFQRNHKLGLQNPGY